MKNPTSEDMNYRGYVIRAGETVPDADLSPEAVKWFGRHGCEGADKPRTVKKKTKATSKPRESTPKGW